VVRLIRCLFVYAVLRVAHKDHSMKRMFTLNVHDGLTPPLNAIVQDILIYSDRKSSNPLASMASRVVACVICVKLPKV